MVCPACGAVASAEAWRNDAIQREIQALSIQLPKPVQEFLVHYLALFRPPGRALSWPRVRRVVAELAALVHEGKVTWERRPPRRCPPEIWARAMAEMIERKGGFKAHFTNHNYLRKIAYDLADRADAEAEARRRRAEAEHRRPEPREEEPDLTPEEVRRIIAETKEKLGIWGRSEGRGVRSERG